MIGLPTFEYTCSADGFVPVGTMGDTRYWHCEAAGVVQVDGEWLCAEHAELEGVNPESPPG